MKKILLGLASLLVISTAVHATPKKVIIIRHAEKIQKGLDLNLQGYERASALPYYFSGTPLYNDLPISHVFATSLDEPKPLRRTSQTCRPTADHLNLPLNTQFKNTETNEIAEEILKNPKYNNSTVLICWSHGHIAPIVQALGGEDPGHWSHNTYDQVYMLTFEGSSKPKFQKILQKLMFGDRAAF